MFWTESRPGMRPFPKATQFVNAVWFIAELMLWIALGVLGLWIITY